MVINFNNFTTEYRKNYLESINLDWVRNQLDLEESDKLKKNGTFERGLYFTDTNSVLHYERVKIQKLQWADVNGNKHYVSVFPNIIMRYKRPSASLIEFISSNVGKGEDILNHINDSACLLECEDTLVGVLKRFDKVCAINAYAGLLTARYTEVYNSFVKVLDIHEFNALNKRYLHIYILVMTARKFFGSTSNVLALSNVIFKF